MTTTNRASPRGPGGGAKRVVPAKPAATRKPARVSTPWGPAERIDAVTIPQRAGERRFAVVVELLEARSGDRLVRFAYSTDGTARRGPVALRPQDLARLGSALARAPELREVLHGMV